MMNDESCAAAGMKFPKPTPMRRFLLMARMAFWLRARRSEREEGEEMRVSCNSNSNRSPEKRIFNLIFLIFNNTQNPKIIISKIMAVREKVRGIVRADMRIEM